jgi:hypothetical protein
LFEVVDSSASPTSVEQIQNIESNFTVFPNPFNNYIDVDLKSNELIGQDIRIFDLLGKLVYSEKVRNQGVLRIVIPQKLALIKLRVAYLINQTLIKKQLKGRLPS